VVTNFAASSVLARQIEQGAPADLYLSANPTWMTWLTEKGLLKPENQWLLLQNRLVVVGHSAAAAPDVAPGSPVPSGRAAIADPSHVPAGIYARQALTYLGWWDHFNAPPIMGGDVRATLRLVQLGEADWGVVYASDLKVATGITPWAVLPQESHDPISYPLGLIKDTPAGRAFCVYLRGPEASQLFISFGFSQP